MLEEALEAARVTTRRLRQRKQQLEESLEIVERETDLYKQFTQNIDVAVACRLCRKLAVLEARYRAKKALFREISDFFTSTTLDDLKLRVVQARRKPQKKIKPRPNKVVVEPATVVTKPKQLKRRPRVRPQIDEPPAVEEEEEPPVERRDVWLRISGITNDAELLDWLRTVHAIEGVPTLRPLRDVDLGAIVESGPDVLVIACGLAGDADVVLDTIRMIVKPYADGVDFLEPPLFDDEQEVLPHDEDLPLPPEADAAHEELSEAAHDDLLSESAAHEDEEDLVLSAADAMSHNEDDEDSFTRRVTEEQSVVELMETSEDADDEIVECKFNIKYAEGVDPCEVASLARELDAPCEWGEARVGASAVIMTARVRRDNKEQVYETLLRLLETPLMVTFVDYCYDWDDVETVPLRSRPLVRKRLDEAMMAAPPAPSSEHEVASVLPLEAGTRVRVNYRGLGQVYGGSIVGERNEDGTYVVKYDDGETEASVPYSSISRNDCDELTVGCRVEVNYRGLDAYYPGILVGHDGHQKWQVDYDDGDHESDVASDMIRFVRSPPEGPLFY